ncbi:Histone-lysine N-methyltransferase EZH1 [Cladobotryum mycophilum]|uniref:Histone-lysine N-methyltransferase EZH1 n=1 Tax=Cladobotryum mycophilum TaxID=491253 RepID=A0ABR0SKU9_9HYPO
MTLLGGAGSLDPAVADSSEIDMNSNLFSRLESFGSRRPSGLNGVANNSRAPISPPPLKRLASTAPTSRTGSSPPPSDRASLTNTSLENTREMSRLSSNAPNGSPSRHATTPPSASRSRDRWSGMTRTPKAQTASSSNWTVGDIATRLKTYTREIREGHAQLVAHALESTTTAPDLRVRTGTDLFAGLSITPVAEKKDKTMRVKFKQHLKAKKDHKEEHYNAVCIKTNKDAVPPYRFHHVEIRKNVLTPNTMLTFVPHLRDLEGSEEAKYNLWLKELEDIDLKSGFKPMNREDKHLLTVQSERAATISLYLDSWLDRLAIPHCNKSTLIRYMASQESDDAMTPQQKTDIIKSHSGGDSMTPEVLRAAEMFTSAFQLAFKEGKSKSTAIDLRNVLLLDESVDSVMDSKSAAKEASSLQQENIDEVVESNLATYCILGCLVCFSHSCDHGEYDNKNLKRTFSLSSCSPLSDVLRMKRTRASPMDDIQETPCNRECHRSGITFDAGISPRKWSEDEHIVLRSLFITCDHSKLRMDAICLAAELLNRHCWEVANELESLRVVRPEPEPAEPLKPRNVSWYDRKKKMLLGDWQEHTVSHEHQRREILEPCFHDGPCLPKVCSCVDAGVLCEKFCGCTPETCSYKFMGCACHALGKTCIAKQKDKPCICVQLNRECDPQLCGSCGSLERADPANADDIELHATGCQNCDLQRGLHKSLLLGQSQLEAVGYGLFTAEDIVQDEFIIEYVGELITHDEGVRREARRGDVFDEESNISYVFTLLENEGIWVDAAIYGNLSRYINHASEHDTRGCNITPRILYVNGEYRIKFTALRDIKAGEELFFNYGENFPNLTKKLLDHKAGEKPESGKSKPGRPRRAEAGDRVARKAPKTEQRKAGRPSRRSKKAAEPLSDEEAAAVKRMLEESNKRKRRFQDDSEEEEYHPTGTDGTSHAAESGGDSEELVPDSAKRLRKRSRVRTREHGSPTKAGRNQPKPRGKRGGARPGSGRPRKHPRIEPAPAAAVTSAVAEEEEEEEEEEASASPPPPPPPPPPLPAPALVRTASPEAITTTPKQSKTSRRPEPAEVIEIEDSEDQDVVVRNRIARNRRMPAKFRDDEVWAA